MVEKIAGSLPYCITTDIGVTPQEFFDEELPAPQLSHELTTLTSGMGREDRLITMVRRIRAK